MYTNTQKRKAYLSLPDSIKDIISAEGITDKITTIGSKHNLLIDKQGILVDEIGLVMFGLTHPDKFVESIKNRLEISQSEAEAIATDVNNEILLEIREELKKISAKNAEEEKTSNLAHDSEHPVESDEHHATLKREDILRDIEDPAPVKSPRPTTPINTTAKTSPAPTNLPVAHNDNDLPAIVPEMDHSYPTPPQTQPAPKTPAAPANNIVSAKLSGVVVTATTVISQKPSAPQAPYKADPYRETF